MGLEDYKELVASCASICTMAQMSAGTLICKDIYQKGSSKGFDPMPFLGGIGMCILMLQYAWIVRDPHTKDTRALIGKVAAFVAAFLAYAQVEDPEKLEFRFGLIVTGLFFLLIASPLLHIREIIRTKNTDILPFPLIFMGTIVISLWLLYGIIINNVFIIFQNSVGFVLSVAQLSLFVIYPSKSKGKASSQEKKD